MDETPESDDLLGFLAEDGRNRRDPDDHPSVETLTAYQANELTPEEDSRIQDHLLICKHCTDLVLDFAAFSQLPEESNQSTVDFEQVANWQTLKTKLPLARDYRSPRRTTYAALAAIVLVAIGFSFYILSRSPGEPVTLDPRGNYRSQSKIVGIHLPATLRLKSTSGNFLKYKALLRTRAGESVRQFSDLERTSTFDVEIPLGRQLSLGEYQIDLYGIENGVSTPVDTFDFDVTGP